MQIGSSSFAPEATTAGATNPLYVPIGQTVFPASTFAGNVLVEGNLDLSANLPALNFDSHGQQLNLGFLGIANPPVLFASVGMDSVFQASIRGMIAPSFASYPSPSTAQPLPAEVPTVIYTIPNTPRFRGEAQSHILSMAFFDGDQTVFNPAQITISTFQTSTDLIFTQLSIQNDVAGFAFTIQNNGTASPQLVVTTSPEPIGGWFYTYSVTVLGS